MDLRHGRRASAAPHTAMRMSNAQAAGATVTVDDAAPKKKTSPAQFFSPVRAEGRKIVWPSRQETWITSVMVFIMVAIAAAFFWIVDWVLGYLSTFILAIGQ